ncbi:MAG: hypothetical protein EXQ94_14870 [Alphaproteobacteria bacterium]|nr:hypothetical protein [Alphaproteobacteria bacterium]
MSWGHALIAFIAIQRLAELVYARRNSRRLLAEGAHEVGGGHYPLLVGFHAAWLIATAVAADGPIDPFALGILLALQTGRAWVLVTLGQRWTTRILVPQRAPLVRHGPYRWFRHPNYLIVTGEIAALPLAVGAVGIAIAFSIAHLLVLVWRIRVEDRALARARIASGIPPD